MQILDFTVTGSGKPLVFLHGFCETKNVWLSVHQQLSNQFKVISIDLPGYGASKPHQNLSMESMAEAVYLTLQSIEITSCVLIGHSMGGYVALALAEKYPTFLKGLCMFHSTAFADSEEKKLQRNKTINYLKEHGVESFIRPFVPPLFYPQNRKKCELAITNLIEEGCKISQKTIEDCAIAMRDRPDRTTVLKEATYPVMFIIGKKDTSVKFEDSVSQCHLAAHSYAVFLEDTAHQGIFEREQETISALKAFGNIVFG